MGQYLCMVDAHFNHRTSISGSMPSLTLDEGSHFRVTLAGARAMSVLPAASMRLGLAPMPSTSSSRSAPAASFSVLAAERLRVAGHAAQAHVTERWTRYIFIFLVAVAATLIRALVLALTSR